MITAARQLPVISLGDRFVLALLYLFLAMEVFSGPLRYYLGLSGAAGLVYLPKLLIASVVLARVLRKLYLGRINTVFASVLVLFVAYGFVGALFTQNLMQPVFGIFVLLPLLYAVMAESALRRAGLRILPYVGFLWLAAAIGVGVDYLEDVPWTGLAYQLGDIEIEGSREWTTFGVERVAGFARASYEAADQLLLLALPLVLLMRRTTLKLLVWLATGILIYLTTTKKTGGTYLLITVLLPLIGSGIIPIWIKRSVTLWVPILIATVGIGLPVSTLLVTYRLDLDSFLSQVLFASFEDRLTVVWPASIALALEHGSALLGRGIGGIGSAQKYFEPLLHMPGDNLYIYLYVTFGVLALAFVWIYVWSLCRLDVQHSRWSRFMWVGAIAALLNGWANNGVESPITAIFLGVSMAYAYTDRRSHQGSVRRMRVKNRSGTSPARILVTP